MDNAFNALLNLYIYIVRVSSLAVCSRSSSGVAVFADLQVEPPVRTSGVTNGSLESLFLESPDLWRPAVAVQPV